MVLLEIGLLVFLVAVIVYRWSSKKLQAFASRGIPFEKVYFFTGGSARMIRNKSSMHKEILDFYSKKKHHKIFGNFDFLMTSIFVNEPEYIKKLCITDFDCFPNRIPFMKSLIEPMANSMLTVMKDQRWKNMRNTLTPAFTAAKMRSMFGLMNEAFHENIRYLRKQSTNGLSFDIEIKECFTRLSNDIIASTAFGLQVNSYEDRDNKFYTIGQSVTNLRGGNMLKFTIINAFPRLSALLNLRLFDKQKSDYFFRLVVDAMKQRQEQNIVRPDMIQLLIEAKKESDHDWTDAELVAQCFIFFFAAFENNANLICVTCHELMENPAVQQRLYEEVLEIKNDLGDKPLNYDTVNKMQYMDMVVSESLRKWTLAAVTDRVCSKDYKLYDDDGNFVFEFKEGDNVWFPILGMHRDEQYFPDPDTFDPERFSEENKKNIVPCSYMPFGIGLRNCIGNRYALMQAKAMLYYLLLNFKLERSEKTVKDLLDDIRGFQINPESGFWLKFVPRK